MEVKIKLPKPSTIAELRVDLREVALPYLMRQAPIRLRSIRSRVQVKHTATDGNREWSLPPYNAKTTKARKRRGLGTQVDYTRSGALMRSLVPKIVIDSHSGGLLLRVSPSGRRPGVKKRKGFRRREEYAVKTMGDTYLRQTFTYSRKGKRVRVPAHFVKMPPKDLESLPHRSRSGWWFWVYYRQQEKRAAGEGKHKRTWRKHKVLIYNAEVAYHLGKRLGRGRWVKGRNQRPSPFLSLSPADIESARNAFEVEAMDKMASRFWKGKESY